MKTNIIFAFLMILVMGGISMPASAQSFESDITLEGFYGEETPSAFLPEKEELKPTPTQSQHIALLFYKFSGQLPEFEKWVEVTEEYQKADEFERPNVMAQKVKEFRDKYVLTTVSDSVVFYTPIKISPYSFKNKGFIVTEGFSEQAFFPFEYVGRHYAVVIPDLPQRQWLPIADEKTAMRIDVTAEKNNRTLDAMLEVEPTYADPEKQIFLNGKNYWLISARIRKLALYNPLNDTEKLWTDGAVTEDDATQQELLNLYR